MLLRKNKLSVIYLDQNLGSTTIKNGLYQCSFFSEGSELDINCSCKPTDRTIIGTEGFSMTGVIIGIGPWVVVLDAQIKFSFLAIDLKYITLVEKDLSKQISSYL